MIKVETFNEQGQIYELGETRNIENYMYNIEMDILKLPNVTLVQTGYKKCGNTTYANVYINNKHERQYIFTDYTNIIDFERM